MSESERTRKWIPVTEELPKGNRLVLTYWRTAVNIYALARYSDGVWYLDGEDPQEPDIITHWMPLPEPPESESVSETKG